MRMLAIICLVGCSTTVDSPLPKATVHAYEEGLGAAGRVAVFGDAGGRLKSVQVTDQHGIASAVVDAGDVVTIANVGASRFELTSYVDIRPGDEMVIGETEDEGNAGVADAGALIVSVSTVPDGMRAEVGVGRSTVPHVGRAVALHLGHDLFADAAATVQVLGIARDVAGVARAFAIGETAGPGTVTLPAWRTDWDRIAFSIGAVAASATLEAHAAIVQGKGHFRLEPVTTAVPELDIMMPRGLGTELEYEIAVRDGACTRSVVELGALRHDVNIDASSLLPTVTSPNVAPSANGRPLVSWTVGAETPVDVVLVQLAWGDGAHVWTIALPPGHAGSLRLPELPDSLAAWRPTGAVRVGVAVVELSSIASYHELMKRGIEGLDELAGPGVVRISRAGEISL